MSEQHSNGNSNSLGLTFASIGPAAFMLWFAVLLGLPLGWAAAIATVGLIAGGLLIARHLRLLRAETQRMTQKAAELQRSLQPKGKPASNVDGSPGLEALLDQIRRDLDRRVSDIAAERRDLQAVINAIKTPVIATNDDGLVQLSNIAADRMFGDSAGRMVEELFTQPDVLVLHGRALRGEAGTRQIRLARDGQIRVFDVTAGPADLGPPDDSPRRPGDTDARGVVLTLSDVTELATAMQLKTDFVANASHELRTPLASIRAGIDTLREFDDDARVRARSLELLEGNSIRLEEMVRDLLDLSRLETPEAEIAARDCSFDAIAEAIAPMFDTVCSQRRLELIFEIDPTLRSLRTDPKLIGLILKNLIENATKFATEGTAIRVTALPMPPAQGTPPTLSGDPLPWGMRLTVADKGQGIPLAQQSRIFERFYQVDAARSGNPQQRGTGLGLAIVKHAVRNLGGSVSLESVYKQGTTMIVELPACVIPSDDPNHGTLWDEVFDEAQMDSEAEQRADQSSSGATSTPAS
ncbi:MAG: ATP-binding protein [Planctomycetota bacterium]